MTISGFENIHRLPLRGYSYGRCRGQCLLPARRTQPVSNGQPFIDTIRGGAGIDTLVIDCSDEPDANALGVFMTPNAISGPEPISFGQIVGLYFPFVRYTYESTERFNITGANAADQLYGENYNDVLIGLGGNDLLGGVGGDDLLDGGDGNDTLNAGHGSDTLLGGSGNDAINFDRAQTTVTGIFGHDRAYAGPGDDVINNPPSSTLNAAAAEAGAIFECDGGEGYDTLSGNFANQSMPIFWDESKPIDITFPNGSFIRSIERLSLFISGNGNDIYLFQGRENTQINLNGGNDIISPGLGFDTIQGGNDDDLVIIDYSLGDDDDASGVTWYSAFSPARHERRRISDNVIIDQLVLSTCERMHCTGTSKADQLYGLNGNDVIVSGAGDDFIRSGQGNDSMDGGPGADRMEGEQGNDFYLVDNVGDVVSELNSSGFDQGGFDTVQSSVDITLPTGLEHLNLTGNAQRGTGNASSNTLIGNTQNNLLQGFNGNDTLNGGGGANEIDRLNGGANIDTFVLGDGSVRFYDDGNPATPGHGGYAIIEDFTPAHADKLRLTGSAAQYFLAPSPITDLTGTALYHDSNANAVLDPATDELIAVLISPVTLTVANTLTPSLFPDAVTLESIGLTASPVITTLSMSPLISTEFAFTLNESISADILLRLQTSTDLGAADSWQTIATKNGNNPWLTSLTNFVSPPTNGQVDVRFTYLSPSNPDNRRFFRIHVSR